MPFPREISVAPFLRVDPFALPSPLPQTSLSQQNSRDASRELAPCGCFGGELRASLPRQPIELGATAQLRLTPLGFEPSPSLHPIERWVQRPLLDDDRLVRGVLDELGDGVAVPRAAG